MSDPTKGRKPDAPANTASTASPKIPHAPPARPAPTTPAHDDGEVDGLTPAQVTELKGVLEKRRAEIAASIEGRRGEDRDLGRDVGDEMDEANTEGASAMATKLLERDAQLLHEIDRALAKIPLGEYGLCEGTGEPIGFARLKLRPWARFSIEHQEEVERAQRSRGGVI